MFEMKGGKLSHTIISTNDLASGVGKRKDTSGDKTANGDSTCKKVKK